MGEWSFFLLMFESSTLHDKGFSLFKLDIWWNRWRSPRCVIYRGALGHVWGASQKVPWTPWPICFIFSSLIYAWWKRSPGAVIVFFQVCFFPRQYWASTLQTHQARDLKSVHIPESKGTSQGLPKQSHPAFTKYPPSDWTSKQIANTVF